MAVTEESEEEISILVEFMSAMDILIGDVVSSDPYVQVKLGKETVHKTKYIPKTYVISVVVLIVSVVVPCLCHSAHLYNTV